MLVNFGQQFPLSPTLSHRTDRVPHKHLSGERELLQSRCQAQEIIYSMLKSPLNLREGTFD